MSSGPLSVLRPRRVIAPPRRGIDVAASRRIGLVGTYPPKICGLATFGAALESAFVRQGHVVDIVRIDDGDDPASLDRPVAAEIVNGKPGTIRRAASLLSRCDVAIVQHEYGIFGGPDGDEVLDLLQAIDVPVVVVLHTVPLQPSANQRSVLAAVTRLADRVVVMTATAQKRLVGSYPVESAKVIVISHGAEVPSAVDRPDRAARHGRLRLLTWGLLGPGKGIEHAIDALAQLDDLPRRPHYTVAGVTHPKVLARDGDVYRRSLITRTWSAGIAGSVKFDDTYRDLPELTAFVASSSVVVLPYDSRDQVTSGVLVDAIAAGRPVIATGFPHAVEMLRSGAGMAVPHADPAALADALRAVVTDPDLLESMEDEARRIAPTLSWDFVAGQYVELCDAAVDARKPVAI
jgi:glycosyltransferase involved in cell wall biosynthesis